MQLAPLLRVNYFRHSWYVYAFFWHMSYILCYLLQCSLAKTLELFFLLHKSIILFRVMLSPVGKTNRYNKPTCQRQNKARRNQTGTDLYRTVCSFVSLVSNEELEFAIHLPISQSACLKETQYISIMFAHMRQQTSQSCLPSNSLLRYAILPLGQSQHYYPGHTHRILLPCWYHNLWNSRRASGLSHAPSSFTDKFLLHQCNSCTSYQDPPRLHVDIHSLQASTVAHTHHILSSSCPHLLSSNIPLYPLLFLYCSLSPPNGRVRWLATKRQVLPEVSAC